MHLLLQVGWSTGKLEAAILREDNRFLATATVISELLHLKPSSSF